MKATKKRSIVKRLAMSVALATSIAIANPRKAFAKEPVVERNVESTINNREERKKLRGSIESVMYVYDSRKNSGVVESLDGRYELAGDYGVFIRGTSDLESSVGFYGGTSYSPGSWTDVGIGAGIEYVEKLGVNFKMGGHFLLTLPKFTSYDIAEVGWGSDFWYRSENFYPLNSEWAVGAVADGIAGIGPSVKFNVTIRDFGGEFMLTPAYNTNSGKFGGFAIFRASYSK